MRKKLLLLPLLSALILLSSSCSWLFSQVGDMYASGRIVDVYGKGIPGVDVNIYAVEVTENDSIITHVDSRTVKTGSDGKYYTRISKADKLEIHLYKYGSEFYEDYHFTQIYYQKSLQGFITNYLGAMEFPYIQNEIDQAQEGDIIVVCPGVYKEAIDFKGKAITLRSLAPDDPECVAKTIIDARGQHRSVVTMQNGETDKTRLTGLTLANGTGTIQNGDTFGAGIYLHKASPEIKRNVITGNAATFGGGIYISGSSNPTIIGNQITHNCAYLAGGGLYAAPDANACVAENLFSFNEASTGGAIYIDANATLVDTVGNPLTVNDTMNTYDDNVPDDLYFAAN